MHTSTTSRQQCPTKSKEYRAKLTTAGDNLIKYLSAVPSRYEPPDHYPRHESEVYQEPCPGMRNNVLCVGACATGDLEIPANGSVSPNGRTPTAAKLAEHELFFAPSRHTNVPQSKPDMGQSCNNKAQPLTTSDKQDRPITPHQLIYNKCGRTYNRKPIRLPPANPPYHFSTKAPTSSLRRSSHPKRKGGIHPRG